MKRIIAITLAAIMAIAGTGTAVFADATSDQAKTKKNKRSVRIEFTSDIHSYVDVTRGNVNGKIRDRGGVARLSTLLKKHKRETKGDTIYLDGGDFSQGTLFQAGYIEEAGELSLLADVGLTAGTIGNHEWDLAGTGFADMLNTAMAKNEKLPPLLCANLDFSGELTEEQAYVQKTLKKYVKKTGQDSLANTIIKTKSGLKIGLFGITGKESIEDSPTSGMKWLDQIETATAQVEYLKDKCDMIICISHSGVESTEEGEDFEIARACPDIDMIISGHSHTFLYEPVMVGNTLLAASGEYLAYMGYVDATVDKDGNCTFENYNLDPVDASIARDPEIQPKVNAFKQAIDEEYLAPYGVTYDQVVAHCGYDFTSLQDMYETHDEYPMGDLIADSYLYEAKKNGINDIDVALVGLGTIRGSFSKGDITVANAFEICSLGAGKDNSSGHPILSAYITGAELKLLVELDASLGPLVSSIKMSYAGLEYKFNDKRAILDKVTSVHIVREDGTREKIYDDKMYKVCCNMYAANMLGMLNGLTRGILKIVPKDKDGTEISEFYDYELVDTEGREIKEWYAFADYLSSFKANEDGVSEIPAKYQNKQGRKVKYEQTGVAAIKNPGGTTIASMVGVLLLLGLLILVERKIRKRVKKRRMKI